MVRVAFSAVYGVFGMSNVSLLAGTEDACVTSFV